MRRSVSLTRNVGRLFVQSRTIQERLAMWPSLRSTVLYPPAPVRPTAPTATVRSSVRVSPDAAQAADLSIAALAEPAGAGVRLTSRARGRTRGSKRTRRARRRATASRSRAG
jgi:hypothetical protein